MFNPVHVGKKTRYSYARIKEVMEMPHLLDIQRNSYDWFKKNGLEEIFKDISPISDFTGNLELFFESFTFGQPKYSLDECKKRDGTYAAPVRVKVKLRNKAKGEVKEQEVFLGDFPLMTDTGTFIINGAERVIVSQLVRSPGVYYDKAIDQTGRTVFTATIIPNRGAWIELESDSNFNISVRIDRTRKMPVSYFLRALDFESNEQIIDIFHIDAFISSKLELLNENISSLSMDSEDIRFSILARALQESLDFEHVISYFAQFNYPKFDSFKFLLDLICSIEPNNPLAAAFKAFVDQLDTDRKNNDDNKERALLNLYSRLRPGEPPSSDNALSLLNSLFFDTRRYDLANVGRYKFSYKLGFKNRILGLKLFHPNLLPHNQPISRELINDLPDNSDLNLLFAFSNFGICPIISPPISSDRILSKLDIIAAINFFFQLFANIAKTDDIDHLGNRRVRAVGELLQNQFRIGMARMERVVRERMTTQDPDIVTPQNLINIRPVVAAIKEFFGSSQLSQFMDQHNPLSELTHKRRLSALGPGGLSRERAGFDVRDVHVSHYGRMCPIETPEGPNIGLIGSLSNFARINNFGFIESPYRIVDKFNSSISNDVIYLSALEEEHLVIAQANEKLSLNGDKLFFKNPSVTARFHQHTQKIPASSVDLMDVSPRQVVSIAAALIPFLENDDANRALMGANMQRQAVPLLKPAAPFVGTGMEFKAACDSGVMILAKHDGFVSYVDSASITISHSSGKDFFYLKKFVRSNQGTCFNQFPIVHLNQFVKKGQPIADGPATQGGELALGYNILVAYMPWEGYNYEDAILLNENLIKNDIFSSIHIEEFQCDARDTKLGAEDITRDIPNVSEDALTLLDSEGIIAIGSDVRTGDILVGKVTPKGETELTAEERLLRAIFGEKAREVRDTSLRVPHGEAGKVVSVNIFTRDNNDDMPPGVNKQVRVYIAQKRKISVGDKMSGRHGNKGVVSEIRRQEDMPFLPDGTPVDIVLNPLGVPSRMNIGQVLETHLGMALRKASILFHFLFPLIAKAKFAFFNLVIAKASLSPNLESNISSFNLKFSAFKKQLNKLPELSLSLNSLNSIDIPDISELESSIAQLQNALPNLDFSSSDILHLQHALDLEIINLKNNSLLQNAIQALLKLGYDPAKLDLNDILNFQLPQSSNDAILISTPVFDGVKENELSYTMQLAGMPPDGKSILYDGRTGLPFHNRVTVGSVYMLKLHHLVDDKIHARSTGPYSLVTQQPLGGKAQFGGQRFGEMEVWALEAYGAAFSLQEILTVKSDDVVGRVKAYEAIVKGQNIPEPGVPESFKVLIKELQSIALDIRVLSNDSKEIFISDDDDDDLSIKRKANDLDIDVGTFALHDTFDTSIDS